jgi:hypothetical protein
MDNTQQVVVLLKVFLLVGPLALYFMVLGLLNSQPAARLIDARSDFLMLTACAAPLLLAPAVIVVRQGYEFALLPVLVAAVVMMRALLPRRHSGWVIYNLPRPRAQVLVERCLRELGWAYRVGEGCLEVPQRGLLIRFSGLPILRNVTCHLSFDRAAERCETAALLRSRLENALARQQLLPSLAGSCLMMLGIGLILLPLWMMSRHSEAIAEVVTRLLLS